MTGLRESGKKIKNKKRTKEKIQNEGRRFKVVIEELKQRISVKSEKLRCYRAQDKQYRQNKLS